MNWHKDSLEKAVKLKPRFARAHFELGRIYIGESKNKKAEEHFQNAVIYSPESQFARQSREYLEKINQEK